jgi:hypothetical protein
MCPEQGLAHGKLSTNGSCRYRLRDGSLVQLCPILDSVTLTLTSLDKNAKSSVQLLGCSRNVVPSELVLLL